MRQDNLNCRRILHSTRWPILAIAAAHLYGLRAWPLAVVCLVMWVVDKGE